MLKVPDDVWDSERNISDAHQVTLRQSSPPSSAWLNIRLIYNNGWVQSSASGNTTLAHQRALEVLREAENIYSKKYSSSSRLGTTITFDLVRGGIYSILFILSIPFKFV